MPNSGKQVSCRLFECDECHSRRYVSWVELNRAAKPRCHSCGSTRLDLVSEEAKEDQARLNRERLSAVGSGRSMVRGKSSNGGRHAVR